jgi:hypothetical protein
MGSVQSSPLQTTLDNACLDVLRWDCDPAGQEWRLVSRSSGRLLPPGGVLTGLRPLVARARANGRSWGEIGIALGVSRQAARERFAEKIRA